MLKPEKSPRFRLSVAPGIFCPHCTPERAIQSHDFEFH